MTADFHIFEMVTSKSILLISKPQLLMQLTYTEEYRIDLSL